MEGEARLRLAEIGGDLMLFPPEVFVNGGVEFRPRQPVGGISVDRLEAAADFMLPLSARIEVLKPVADAVLDALVVAGFEMQAVELLLRAPMAAVKGICAPHADGCGHGFTDMEGEDHQQRLRQGAAQLLEERPGQVAPTPALRIGCGVEAV